MDPVTNREFIIRMFKPVFVTNVNIHNTYYMLKNNSIYNIGTGVGTTIYDVITQMAGLLDTKLQIHREPIRKGEIGNFIADTRKLEKTFGKKPNTSINDGLELTLSWLKNQ